MGANPRGKAGEDYTAGLLEREGYVILDRNFHSRRGEVDIVATKGEVVCFVEVKTRCRGALVSGALAVGREKQRRIITTALFWLQRHPECDDQPRFDVCVVETDGRGNILTHDYIEGAFDGEAYTGKAGF